MTVITHSASQMDDRFDHLHGWSWGRSGDEKYCDGIGIAPEMDGSEPYVDSLHQLNKIVERILPECPTISVTPSRSRMDLSAVKKPHMHETLDASYESLGKRHLLPMGFSSGHSSYDAPLKKSPPVSGSTGDFVHESLHLKMLRTNDSLNDSAYETFCGDGSIDAADAADQPGKMSDAGFREEVEGSCDSPKRETKTESSFSPAQNPQGIATGDEKAADVLDNPEEPLSRKGSEFTLCNASVEFRGSKCTKLIIKREVIADNAGTDGSSSWSKHIKEGELSESEEGCGASQSKFTASCQEGINLQYSKDSSQMSNDSAVNLPCSSEWSSSKKHLEIRKQHSDDGYPGTVDSSVHNSTLHSTLSCPALISGSSTTTFRGAHLGGKPREQHLLSTSETSVTGAGDEEPKSFSCPHCAYCASKKGQVRKHMSVHGIFLCAHCEFACDRAELLEEHRRQRHPGLCGRRLCKKCRVLFQSSELEAHERQCSGEKQRWACPTCGKEFKFLSVMKAHAHKWHPPADGGLTLSTTSVDDSSTVSGTQPNSSSPQSFEGSRPTPSDIKPSTAPVELKLFQCTECGKTFKTKWTLSNHSMLHAGADTPFCCDVDGCSGVTFRSDKELNCHRQNVHQLGPTKYECSHPNCTMQFAKYGHFKRHQLTHAASSGDTPSSTSQLERKYRCDWPQCGKAFCHQDNLRVHYRRHTDEKPYHCHHCEAAYRQKSGLKYHLEKVHGEKSSGRCGRKRKVVDDGSKTVVLPMTKPSYVSGPVAADADSVSSYSLASKEASERHSGDAESGSGTRFTDAARNTNDHVGVKFKLPMRILADTGKTSTVDVVSNRQGNGHGVPDGNSRYLTPEIGDDDCRDDLGDIGLNDEWMLDDDNETYIGETDRSVETKVPRREESDRDAPGSTSDTEPLDEDFCEELRKLSDVINSGDLSPQGINSPPTPFGSQLDTEEFCNAPAPLNPGVGLCSGSNPRSCRSGVMHNQTLYHSNSSQDEQSAYDQFTAPSHMDIHAEGFYSRHASIDDVSVLHHDGGQGMLDAGSHEAENGSFVSDMYYCRTDSAAPGSCYPVETFDSPSGACLSVNKARHSASIESENEGPCRQVQFDATGQQWVAPVNSPFWASRATDNASSMSAHSAASNAGIPLCSSAGPEFVDQPCHRDDTYPGAMSNWSSLGSNEQYAGQDNLFRGWCRQQPSANSVQSDLCQEQVGHTYGDGSPAWHMGRQGESAFTRSGIGGSDPNARFDIGHCTASPGLSSQYRMEFSALQERVAETFNSHLGDGYSSNGVPISPWAEFYGRTRSASGSGMYIGSSYDHCLSGDVGYKPSSPPDRFYFAPGQAAIAGLPMRSDYEHGAHLARPNSSYGFMSNGYSLPPMHTPSWRPASSFGDDGECLRPHVMPGAVAAGSQMPYQQGSVLYNMVPRYY